MKLSDEEKQKDDDLNSRLQGTAESPFNGTNILSPPVSQLKQEFTFTDTSKVSLAMEKEVKDGEVVPE